jgi:hypothetical protein
MKKFLVLAIMFISIQTFAQDKPFRERYSFSITNNDEMYNKLDLFVVFNHKKTKQIIFYFTRKTMYFYRTSEVTKGKTETGEKYQMFECLESGTNKKIIMQLFHNELKLYAADYYINFYK